MFTVSDALPGSQQSRGVDTFTVGFNLPGSCGLAETQPTSDVDTFPINFGLLKSTDEGGRHTIHWAAAC